MKIVCPQCRKEVEKGASAVNRAHSRGAPLYCGRMCFGLARRDPTPKSDGQRKADKKLYDAQYRLERLETIRARKREYHLRTYDPDVERVRRAANMPRHVEYCRRPEYREWKSEYDRRYRAKEFGDFAEAYMLLVDLDREVNSRMSDYDVRVANGTLNKKLKRSREYGRIISSQSEAGALGDIEFDQE